MAILGLTHDDTGAALKKLPVTIKVAIGEGPEAGDQNGHPRKLDHFVFKRKTLRGQDVVWEPAPEISNAHGEKPTALGIIFLSDDPAEVFRTEYALWAPSGCKCRGELVQIANNGALHCEMRATRRTQKHPEGETWPGDYKYVDGPKKGQAVEPCGDCCPDLARGDCKPSGDLYFILEKFPTLGSVCRLHTSSYRSIRNLSNGLMQIRRLNGGHLTGVRATLKASPESIRYVDQEGFRHVTVAYILSLEIGAPDLRSLVATMTEPARLLSKRPSLVVLSRETEYEAHETDKDRAEEISREFYPPVAGTTSHAAEANENQESERAEQLGRISDLCRRIGLSQGKTKLLLGQWCNNLTGLERKLLGELDVQPDANCTDS